MLDTDQLRSFLAIVDTGSFTRAAERVNKTQSAVSMHVRRLEEQLGCTLFVKQGRGARLSEEGEKLIDFARRMMQIEAGALAALSPVVRAGLAVTILPLGTVPADLRVIGAESGLPKLPTSRMGLIHAPGHQSQEAAALADAIRATVGELKQAAA